MNDIEKVLVVGGGICGMALTMLLRREAVEVDLIDIDPDWRVYGAGITITGPTLRAYRRLGLLDAIKAEGAITNGNRLRLYDGTVVQDLDEPALEDGLPATGGILRPTLHRIMSTEVRDSGANIRLGLSVNEMTQDENGVDVTFTDGSTGRYDLVIGADGIYSRVRALTFPDAVAPKFTGQSLWRVLADRPSEMERGEFYLGHRNAAGITACSPTKVYLWLIQPDPDKTRVDPDEEVAKMREQMADFGGNAAVIRDGITSESSIIFRPLESALQPPPWHSGRVVIVGDAAHATTPHLASGAGIAVEDALVLVEELGRGGRSIDAVLQAYTDRRFERCRDVVETSVKIGQMQLAGATVPEIGAVMAAVNYRLAQDI